MRRPRRAGALPLGGYPPPGPWATEAACRGLEPELFMSALDNRTARTDLEAAAAVCRTCPVHVDCLDYALGAGRDLLGVWAGTTPGQRRRLRQTVRARLAAGARAFEQPPGGWRAACDDCGSLQACPDQDTALRVAIGHRWVIHRRAALQTGAAS